MAATYFFGELPGQPVGTVYATRMDAVVAGVHQVPQQGIAGNRDVGCASIVLSGGYDTDQDFGHEIFYTGRGGQNSANKSGPHIEDQTLDVSENAALVRSETTGLPIRILRGAAHDAPFSPSSGYRYDGLYRVVQHYPHRHEADGFIRWMFRLVQLTAAEALEFTPPENLPANANAFMSLDLGSGSSVGLGYDGSVDPLYQSTVQIELPPGEKTPGSTTVVTQRVIRDTKVAVAVKTLYNSACQVCGTAVVTGDGLYAEGAHIRPLGKPHHGPDVVENILCLCPNHHAAFDRGGIYIDDDLGVRDANGTFLSSLKVVAQHHIDANHVTYHRIHHGFPSLITL